PRSCAGFRAPRAPAGRARLGIFRPRADRGRTSGDLAVDGEIPEHHSLDAERVADAPPARGAEPRAQLAVAHQPIRGLGPRARVPGRHEHAADAVVDDI